MSIRGRIISMVLLLELVLMVAAVLLFFNEHQKREQETLFYIGNSLKNHFERNATETEQRYSSRVAGFVKSNPEVLHAFIKKDEKKLSHLLDDRIETFRKEDDFFSCITFALSDGTVFFHSLNPQRIGKNVADIPFARESFETREPLGGLVLSLAGLAYRYSYPIFDQQRYVGMVVLVVKPTRAITILADDFNAECGILVDRMYVDRFEDENVRKERPFHPPALPGHCLWAAPLNNLTLPVKPIKSLRRSRSEIIEVKWWVRWLPPLISPRNAASFVNHWRMREAFSPVCFF